MDPTDADAHEAGRLAVIAGVLLGVGLIGALDEIVFHQLLQWHNFYVDTSRKWRIFSDGLFHLFTAMVLGVAAGMLWTRRRELAKLAGSGRFLAAILVGVGGFQLFDGIVNHKLLQLHPIREGVDSILPYDLAWNIPAAVIFAAGLLLVRRGSQTTD